MTLKERITEDMKTAMRSGEKDRLAVIRLLQAAIKQIEVDERIVLDDAKVTSVLEKMIKQRKESIVAFEKGARADLVAIEDRREEHQADDERVQQDGDDGAPLPLPLVRDSGRGPIRTAHTHGPAS